MKILTLIIALIFITTFSSADIITLKSGGIIEGKIIEQTDDVIKVDTGIGVSISYFLDEIENIKENTSSETDSAEKKESGQNVTTSNIEMGDFKDNLAKNNIFGFEIYLPNYLRESFWESGKVDPEKTKIFDDPTQMNSVFMNRESFNLSFNTMEILYSTDINPLFNMHRKKMKGLYESIERIEKKVFDEFIAFVITGKDKAEGGSFRHGYEIFNKTEQWILTISIKGRNDYFFNRGSSRLHYFNYKRYKLIKNSDCHFRDSHQPVTYSIL